MLFRHCFTEPLRRQSGFTLIIALIFLVVLTLFATAGVRTTLLQERMAGNSIDMNVSFQATELAVRQAENRVASRLNVNDFTAACSSGLCATGQAPYWADASTWEASGSEKFVRVNAASTALSSMDPPLADSPKYMIEYVGAIITAGEGEAQPDAFRVISHGVGSNSKTESNVMTTYLLPPLN